MSPRLVELKGAEYEHASGFRLESLDLCIDAGESVALVGPNGAGKSTVLRLISGELTPATGTVTLCGTPLSSLGPADVARRVAHLRQQADPAFAASALEVVLHGRWVHLRGLRFPGPEDLDKARAALDRVGAAPLEERDFRTLSGGERQRVLFAKALVQETPLLLLDEPTAGLDLHHGVAVTGLAAREVREKGLGQLLVTHDLALAAWSCERAVLLNGGRVLASGTVEDVFTPELLSEAFGHAVDVNEHPETGRPVPQPRFPPLY